MQNEFGFDHNAAFGRFVAKRMFEILHTFTAFRDSDQSTKTQKEKSV